MGVFQRTFSVSLHRIGRPVAVDTPLPSGPRNCGHWARMTRATTHRRINTLIVTPVTSRVRAEPADLAEMELAPQALLLRFDFVVDQDDEIFGADLLQAVRAAGAREDGGPGRDVDGLAVERHLPAAAQHVVDLVLFLRMQADARSGMERALPED